MKILMYLTLFFNILCVAVLTFGLFANFETPKHKAIYGYTIAGTMIPLLLLLSIVAIKELIFANVIIALLLILSALSPFIIGKLVTYKTLKMFTVVQILFFCMSFILLVAKLGII